MISERGDPTKTARAEVANWMFQGNPKRFPVLDHLLTGETDVDWSMVQHIKDVSEDDNAALWVSGERSGIYAIGHVRGLPFEGVRSSAVVGDAGRGRRVHVCPLRWTDILVQHPILKDDLLEAGGFERARIITQPMAGNPTKLTTEEWEVIQRLRYARRQKVAAWELRVGDILYGDSIYSDDKEKTIKNIHWLAADNLRIWFTDGTFLHRSAFIDFHKKWDD